MPYTTDMHRVPNRSWIALLAGVLPILAAHLAWLLNLSATALAPEFVCNPYLDGCVSISRAARSGPGLWLFRGLMLPSAILLLLTWLALRAELAALGTAPPRRPAAMAALGVVGAVFLVFYVTALGHVIEWWYALAMSLAFVAAAWLLARLAGNPAARLPP